MDLRNCAETLKLKDKILVLSHVRPDGDTLGSGAALTHALRRMGKTAYMFRNPQTTERYLDYVQEYFAPDNFAPEYVVAVDVASKQMIPEGYCGQVNLCIDHHPSNGFYAGETVLGADRAACGEIILELIEQMTGGIDHTEAQLLYIAISTDTGCFRYSNTNADTFRAAAIVMDAGADLNKINLKFFRTVSRARLELEGRIYSAMTFHFDDKVAVSTVTEEMIQESGASEDDCDDLANLASRAASAEVAVTIRELENGTASFRCGRGLR